MRRTSCSLRQDHRAQRYVVHCDDISDWNVNGLLLMHLRWQYYSKLSDAKPECPQTPEKTQKEERKKTDCIPTIVERALVGDPVQEQWKLPTTIWIRPRWFYNYSSNDTFVSITSAIYRWIVLDEVELYSMNFEDRLRPCNVPHGVELGHCFERYGERSMSQCNRACSLKNELIPAD